MAQTALFEDAVIDRTVPVLTQSTVYTRIGDWLPMGCLIALLVFICRAMAGNQPSGPGAMLVKLFDGIKQMVSRMTDKRR